MSEGDGCRGHPIRKQGDKPLYSDNITYSLQIKVQNRYLGTDAAVTLRFLASTRLLAPAYILLSKPLSGKTSMMILC
jgi:hypothetical protein